MDQTRPPAQWRPDAKTRAQAKEARARHPLSGLIKAVYRRVPRLRPFCLKLCDRLEGGQYFSATWRQILAEMHGAQVGRYTYGPVLRPGCVPRGSTVGAYCSIAPGLVIRRRDHPIERPALHAFFYNAALGLLTRDTIQLDQENPLEIGHDVWIGDGVTILSGCKRVGNGAVLAAGCVVTKDVAPYTIVGGVPAKPLKVRFSDEEIARIEASRWWERDIADLAGDPAFTEITGVPEDFGQGWG